jgi:hypothetical protein
MTGLIGDWSQRPTFVPSGHGRGGAAGSTRDLFMKEEHFATLRRHMVEVILIYVDLARDELGKSVLDERVLAAMGRVPRHAFVPPPLTVHAYQSIPLPIGFDKTISQPFIVAVMTDLLEPRPDDTVLEIDRPRVSGGRSRPTGSPGMECRDHRGTRRRGRGTPAPAGLRQHRYPHRRWFPGVGRACALRQDHRHGGGRAGASGLGPAAQARRPDGAAHGLGRGTEADGGREGRGGADPSSRAYVGPVRSARDGAVASTSTPSRCLGINRAHEAAAARALPSLAHAFRDSPRCSASWTYWW